MDLGVQKENNVGPGACEVTQQEFVLFMLKSLQLEKVLCLNRLCSLTA